MAINGIGRLVSQYVHERNAARAAARTTAESGEAGSPASPVPAPATDTAEFSADALARFEAWKAKREPLTPGGPPPVEPLPVKPLPVEPLPVTVPTVTD